MNAKKKGSEGERELLEILKAHGIEAHRNDHRYIGGLENPDVAATIRGRDLHIEVKRREKLSAYEAIAQAERDCGHALPIVAYRKNRAEWLCIMPLSVFFTLMEVNAGHVNALESAGPEC